MKYLLLIYSLFFFNFANAETRTGKDDILMVGKQRIPDGYSKVYNINRQIAIDGVFKNGKMVKGKMFVYQKSGVLDKIMIIENYRYVRDEFWEERSFRKMLSEVKIVLRDLLEKHFFVFKIILKNSNLIKLLSPASAS